MHTVEKRKALARAREVMLGVDRKAEAKMVPCYDVSMVKRLEPGRAAGSRLPKGSNYDRMLQLVPGVPQRGAAWC